jgi:glycosyltransferase involved in cell wall biosynthesis
LTGAETPAVGVVVSTRDREQRLAALLGALRAQTLDPSRFEVIVVDNGSNDGTANMLRGEVARSPFALHVIQRVRGDGPAPARNDGWRATTAPLVAFTDDDCEPAPDWLERGLQTAERSPGAVIQGRTEPRPSESAAAGPFSRTMRITELGPHFQTCNIFYPRVVLEELGGFDERFRQPAGEDTDLAWRAIESGTPVEFEPEALVHHAVEDLGPVGHLRVAGRWSDLMYVLRAHPEYRARTRWRRIFWKRSHALLAAALLGVVLSRRFRPAILLVAPYARHLAQRCEDAGAGPAYAPYFALHDLVEMGAAIRGGVRHRVLVL